MSGASKFLLGGLFLAQLPLAHVDEFSSQLRLGRNSKFWDQVKALERSDDPEQEAIGFFNKKNYGATEGIGQAKFEVSSRNDYFAADTFDTSSFGFSINGLVGGEVYNRISPKVRGYAVWDVALSTRLAKSAPGIGQSGWSYLVGTEVGAGQQRIVQGEAIEFVDGVPKLSAAYFYWGLNLEAAYTSQFTENMRIQYGALLLPTFFYSPLNDDRYTEYRVEGKNGLLRWRTEFEQTYAFQAPLAGGFELGWQAYGGQQPTPVRILPRVWDSIHSLKFFPNTASLLGVGAVARIYDGNRNWSLSLVGGYYGGYFGGGATAKIYDFKFEVGSYGFEQTAKFQLRESRVEYASLGYNYEW